ncbi:oligosaccharide flippase family protein [Motiliproteus sp. SC1-56]|uniref:oligosaccharide flippase family protein n=1 Tax=Motiliproteus sp. SC1-56 TaxID=2799565 RepID=UPI001A905263|nr:oligosaccharide flippase family protein [Motiliproteus sp. SC1-56]
MIKTFLRDSVIYAIPTLFSRGLALLLIPLYTRVLTPAEYGSFDLLMVFAAVINLTVALEVSQALARFYPDSSESQQRRYASSAFWFAAACYGLFVILALSFHAPLSRLVMGQNGLEWSFILGVLYIGTNGLFYLVHNQFRWSLRSRSYALISLLVTSVTTLISVWLAYFLTMGIDGLLIGMLSGTVVGLLAGLWGLRNRIGWVFDWNYLRRMLAFSAPLVPSGVAVWLSTYIDRMMVNYYLSVDDVGIYGMGVRLASVATLLMVGFQGALTPLIYRHYKEIQTPAALARIFRLFVALALLLWTTVSLFATGLIELLTTPQYYASHSIVVYLLPAVLLAQMYIFTPGIGIAKKTHWFLWINAGGAVTNLFFNWILIPLWGIKGAAVATLASYLVVFIAFLLVGQRLYYVPHSWGRLVLALFGSIGLIWTGLMLPLFYDSFFVANIMLIICVSCLIKACGLVTSQDLNVLRSWLSRQRSSVF